LAAPTAGEAVRFIFVGTDFYRKGGLLFLKAFDAVRADHPNMLLTIVSRLCDRDWPAIAPADEVADAARLLDSHRDAIAHYGEIPNDQVLQLMRESHVGVLPSMLDTFGFSVLEMQSNGLPMITSDVQALPELNADDRGWIVPYPNDPLMCHPDRSTPERRRAVNDVAVERLTDCLRRVMADRHLIAEKGQRALEYVRRVHDPDDAVERISRIYDDFNA
jgi:glycosyltransferase involved in cell wall biosynthesis